MSIHRNVQVAVRVRPLLQHEIHSECIVADSEASMITVVPPPSLQQPSQTNSQTNGNNSNNQPKTFSFDTVLSPENTQEDVFEKALPLINHVVEGFHATIFAYGQTGSGKTHTMEGFEYIKTDSGKLKPNLKTDVRRHGVIPRVIYYLFDFIKEAQSRNSDIKFTIKCSYMQIYNEKVYDLLNPSSMNASKRASATAFLQKQQPQLQQQVEQKKKSRVDEIDLGLRVRWKKTDEFYVENLFIFECDSPDQVMDLFALGVSNKQMASHKLNMTSSRSHSLFTIYVEKTDSSLRFDNVVKSRLCLVDLAGSERLALLSDNPSSQLVKESIEINQSLFVLGKVISALSSAAQGSFSGSSSSSNKKNLLHIPYRDSKLTRLLKHSLGGNSLTLIIACISSSESFLDESLNTLTYASRARNIKNAPVVNEDPKSKIIRKLKEEIATLKIELNYLRRLVLQNNIKPPDSLKSFSASSFDSIVPPVPIHSKLFHQVHQISDDPSTKATNTDRVALPKAPFPSSLIEGQVVSIDELKNDTTSADELLEIAQGKNPIGKKLAQGTRDESSASSSPEPISSSRSVGAGSTSSSGSSTSVSSSPAPLSNSNNNSNNNSSSNLVKPENSYLGEKFVDSVKMLKQMIFINGNLRNAYDQLSSQKSELETKCTQLMEENQDIRERLEMLESIVLADRLNQEPALLNRIQEEISVRPSVSKLQTPSVSSSLRTSQSRNIFSEATKTSSSFSSSSSNNNNNNSSSSNNNLNTASSSSGPNLLTSSAWHGTKFARFKFFRDSSPSSSPVSSSPPQQPSSMLAFRKEEERLIQMALNRKQQQQQPQQSQQQKKMTTTSTSTSTESSSKGDGIGDLTELLKLRSSLNSQQRD